MTLRLMAAATLALTAILPLSILSHSGTFAVPFLLAFQSPSAPSTRPVSATAAATVIDITAVDASSRPVSDLTADDLSVMLDGVPRSIVRVRYLPRAALASSGQRIAPAPVVVFVVDERTIGGESLRAVRMSAARLVDQLFDRLGPATRMALVRWPHQRSVELTSNRRSVQSEIARLRGRAEEPSALLPPEVNPRICTGPECQRALAAAGADGPRDADLAAQAVAGRATLWDHGRATLSGLAALGRELGRLFLEHPTSAVQQAQTIADESARFNIGSIGRTINVPTLPLLFLKRVNAVRFTFKDAGEQNLGGVPARVIKYSERSRPTFIRDSRGGNVPASGSFWIDPQSGCVMATRMDVSVAEVQAKALVTYAPDAASALWVPAEMREQYRRDTDDGDFVNTRASYSKFRRFRVTTTETVKAPSS